MYVTTGDVSGSGTDANVYVILYGEKGETGNERTSYKLKSFVNRQVKHNDKSVQHSRRVTFNAVRLL